MRVVNYDELGPGYLSAYGAGRRLLRRARAERPQRLRQRRARARLVGLPVDLQRERLLARLPPAAEPHRDPDVLVHPAAPQHDRRRRPADGLRAPVPVQGHASTRCGMPSRGYYYVLDPPLPVNVLEGEIKGDAKKPILGYVPSRGASIPPGRCPCPTAPEAKAGRRRARGREGTNDAARDSAAVAVVVRAALARWALSPRPTPRRTPPARAGAGAGARRSPRPAARHRAHRVHGPAVDEEGDGLLGQEEARRRSRRTRR